MMEQENLENVVEIYTKKLADIDFINTVGFHITRLKAISATRAFVAIKNNLYEINIKYPSRSSYKIEKGRQGPFISRPIELEKVEIINKNKPILSMKHPIQDINITKNNDDNFIISCIDNHGIISVKILNETETNKEIENPPPLKRRKLNIENRENNTNNDDSSILYSISMNHDNGLNYLFSESSESANNKKNGLFMSGYCAMDRNKDKFVSISSYYKLLNIGIGNKIISNIYLCQTPTTVKYYETPNDSSVILINEGNILSIWDERDIKKCIKRIDLRHKMYGIDINRKTSIKYIGCCGEDKIVYVIDPKKWNVHSMWKSCSKYELLQCKFSRFNDGNTGNIGKYVYCVGMDHDLICGEWETTNFIPKKQKKIKKKMDIDIDIDNNNNSNNKQTAQTKQNRETTTNNLRFQHCFRADSKWIGVDYVFDSNFESMVGITNTATIYVAHKPHLLNPKTHR